MGETFQNKGLRAKNSSQAVADKEGRNRLHISTETCKDSEKTCFFLLNNLPQGISNLFRLFYLEPPSRYRMSPFQGRPEYFQALKSLDYRIQTSRKALEILQSNRHSDEWGHWGSERLRIHPRPHSWFLMKTSAVTSSSGHGSKHPSGSNSFNFQMKCSSSTESRENTSLEFGELAEGWGEHRACLLWPCHISVLPRAPHSASCNFLLRHASTVSCRKAPRVSGEKTWHKSK